MASKIIVQIYEIQTPQEAESMIDLGVDRIGSVVLSGDDWKVPSIREAIAVSKRAGVKHSLIPLFNGEEMLSRAMDYYEPDIVHFCESLTDDGDGKIVVNGFVALQKKIKQWFPEISIMRTIPVTASDTDRIMPTLELAEFFQSSSDYLLTDTSVGSEPVDGYIGITGQTADWSVVKELVQSSSIPVIAAGGLSPENVYDAIMAVQPFGVDSCTRTNMVDRAGEQVRFKKDPNRVQAFVREVRRAEKDLDP